jgi:hypothetical protein
MADIAKLRELYEAATPGEWFAASKAAADGSEAHIANCGGWSESPEETTQVVCVQVDYTCPADDDARLIAAMHEALPALLAIAEGAETDRADARRYRWLRANAVFGRMESRGPKPDFALNCDEPESEWDAAIDAALAGAVTQGEGANGE